MSPTPPCWILIVSVCSFSFHHASCLITALPSQLAAGYSEDSLRFFCVAKLCCFILGSGRHNLLCSWLLPLLSKSCFHFLYYSQLTHRLHVAISGAASHQVGFICSLQNTALLDFAALCFPSRTIQHMGAHRSMHFEIFSPCTLLLLPLGYNTSAVW